MCKQQLFNAFVCSVDRIKKRPVLFIVRDCFVSPD